MPLVKIYGVDTNFDAIEKTLTRILVSEFGVKKSLCKFFFIKEYSNRKNPYIEIEMMGNKKRVKKIESCAKKILNFFNTRGGGAEISIKLYSSKNTYYFC